MGILLKAANLQFSQKQKEKIWHKPALALMHCSHHTMPSFIKERWIKARGKNNSSTLYFICILCSITSLSISSLFLSSLWLWSYTNKTSMTAKDINSIKWQNSQKITWSHTLIKACNKLLAWSRLRLTCLRRKLKK